MLKIYNSLTNQKEEFKSIEPGKVRMYVCGMTVYDLCHLGHARVLVVFDMVTRYLRHIGYDVTYVRNITDVDDKIIARANENGEDFNDLTERFINAMHEDAAALGVLPPDEEPRATTAMDDIISMIKILVEKGSAYPADNGDVYYDVSKFETYGQLSGKKLEDLRADRIYSFPIMKMKSPSLKPVPVKNLSMSGCIMVLYALMMKRCPSHWVTFLPCVKFSNVTVLKIFVILFSPVIIEVH